MSNVYDDFLATLEKVEQDASAALESAQIASETNSNELIAEEANVGAKLKDSISAVINAGKKLLNVSGIDKEAKETKALLRTVKIKRAKLEVLKAKFSEVDKPVDDKALSEALLEYEIKACNADAAVTKICLAWSREIDGKDKTELTEENQKAYKAAVKDYLAILDTLIKDCEGLISLAKKLSSATESVEDGALVTDEEVVAAMEALETEDEDLETGSVAEDDNDDEDIVPEVTFDDDEDETNDDTCNADDTELSEADELDAAFDEINADDAACEGFVDIKNELVKAFNNARQKCKDGEYSAALTKLSSCQATVDDAKKNAKNESENNWCARMTKSISRLIGEVSKKLNKTDAAKEGVEDMPNDVTNTEVVEVDEAVAETEQVTEAADNDDAVEETQVDETEGAAAETEDGANEEVPAEDDAAASAIEDGEEIEVPDEDVLTAGNESLLLLDCLYATSSADDFKQFLSENKVELELYGLVDSNAIARESWEELDADESAVATEARNIVRLNREAQISRETARIAIGLAKQKNDTLYKYYHKYSVLKREYREKIYAKYGQRAQALARRSLMNSRSKASLMNSKTGSSIINKIDSRIKQLDNAGRNKEAITV